MTFAHGPLLVTRSGGEYRFFIEVGQGARHQVHAAASLEEAVRDLLARSHVPAFHAALEELRKIGDETGWDWARIARESEE